MENRVVEVKNIKKSFGGVKALKGVSLDIKAGEIHCLAGENGCGKSTLIKIISGFYQCDEGEVYLNGKKQKKLTPQYALEQGIQVIYQDFSIFPNLTVRENLAMNMEIASHRKIISKKRMDEIAKKAIAKINFKVDLDEIVENLSVADKQMIAISRALLNDAKLIVMDEPTTALTKKEVKALFEIIKQLQAQGIAILFVSHKLDEVFEIAERYTIFRNGENVITGLTKDLDDKKFKYYMTGREFAEKVKLPPLDKAEVLLDVQNLTLANGFKNISFKLHRGEILGITGLLGSGRTELVQSLFGYRQFDSGKVILAGEEVKFKTVKEAIKHGVSYVPEDRLTEGLFLEQSISDNISMLRWQANSKAEILQDDKLAKEVDGWVKDFAIKIGSPANPVQTLSGGNQQKCLLARWLSIDGLKVLILNGPTAGVDIGAKYDIHEIIRKLATEKGIGVIMLSDDVQEVIENCHRSLIMNAGHLTGEVNTQEIDAAELTRLAVG